MITVTKPTRKQINQVFEASHALGVAAFKAGKPCVPALDSDLRALMAVERYEIGDARCLARLDGWHRGWTEANIDAPVETEEEQADDLQLSPA